VQSQSESPVTNESRANIESLAKSITEARSDEERAFKNERLKRIENEACNKEEPRGMRPARKRTKSKEQTGVKREASKLEASEATERAMKRRCDSQATNERRFLGAIDAFSSNGSRAAKKNRRRS